MNFEGSNKLSLNEAISRIEGIRGEIMQLGANDYEQSSINNIIVQLQSGALNPDDAVRNAQQIMSSKNDYH